MTRLKLYQTPEHDCPYLSDREAVTQFLEPSSKPSIEIYTHLSQFGFRRSGDHIYRPSCPDCKACQAIRLKVTDVKLSRSQKRCLKAAAHLKFIHIPAVDSDEHYGLYERYINCRHKDGDMYPATRDLYRSFLLSAWANTHFMEIRIDKKLIACAVYDQLNDGLSAIYCYFDPDYSNLSLGKLAILKEIETTHELALDYLYLGYQIDECDKMNYKTQIKPAQRFVDMQWQLTD